MTRLQVWLDQDPIGWLSHDPKTNRFAFDYNEQWLAAPRSYPLSPRLPLQPDPARTADSHSADVRQFFENLLPEGEALDHAAQAYGISKSNTVGLINALGRETAGAIRVTGDRDAAAAADHADHHDPSRNLGDDADDGRDAGLRLITPTMLSDRIRDRARMPFSVWDGKVRLSIAGYQDKIAVYERDGRWFMVNGNRSNLASTVIVKPVPVRPQLRSLPDNEFMCMQLAQRVGLAVARARLFRVPEPVLLVHRFDRIEKGDRVHRLHLIDGCQALGLAVGMKYERPYGDGRDVRDIRDGVTYAKLFRLLDQSPRPARDKQALLRWVIFQILIGNTDAHGKNVSFFYDIQGLELAPAYDLVCRPAIDDAQLAETFAMAIGDAFVEPEISPFEWAAFARECGLPIMMVSQQLRRLAIRVLDSLPGVVADVTDASVSAEVANTIAGIVDRNCRRQIEMAPDILKVRT